MLVEGAEVSLLHSSERGKIVRILPNGWVTVSLKETDVEVDLREEELVLHGMPDKGVLSTPPTEKPQRLPPAVTLSLQWLEDGLHIWLNNGLREAIEARAYFAGKPLVGAASLTAGHQQQLWRALPAENGQIVLHVLYIGQGHDIPAPPEALHYKWRAAQLATTRSQPLVISPARSTQRMTTQQLTSAVKPTPKAEDAVEAPKLTKFVEVDLHLEAIIPNPTAADDLHVLDIQLAHFETWLNKGILDGCHSMVFIHGVGAGVLRKEIHRKLRGIRAVKSFADDDSGKYGNGATRVMLRG